MAFLGTFGTNSIRNKWQWYYNALLGLNLIPLKESVSVQIPFMDFYIVMSQGT